MRRNFLVVSLFLSVMCAIVASDTFATIINGDFATGDFTGWTVSAFDEFDNPIDPSPFISVTTAGANNVADLKTGQFADGLFIATLEQTFGLTADAPFLSFDFILPTTVADPTGTGTSPFFDAVFVSVDDGVNSFELLQVDQFGALADPFGTASGDVTLSVPSDPIFDFHFDADLSALAGGNLTLFFDVIQEDDGFRFNGVGISKTGLSGPKPPIPEPTTLVLLSVGLIGMLGAGAIKRRREKT